MQPLSSRIEAETCVSTPQARFSSPKWDWGGKGLLYGKLRPRLSHPLTGLPDKVPNLNIHRIDLRIKLKTKNEIHKHKHSTCGCFW